jgi:hypothetical protein
VTTDDVTPGPEDCKGRAERKQAKLWTLAEIEASDAPQWAGDDWPVDENGVHVDPLIARLAVEDSCPAESDAFISAFLAYRALSPEQRAVARRTGKVPPASKGRTHDGEELQDGQFYYLDDIHSARRYNFLKNVGCDIEVIAPGGRVETVSPKNLRVAFTNGVWRQEEPKPQQSKHESAPPDEQELQYPPRTIDEVLEVFERWLLLTDRTPIYAVLGAVAANLLPGDAIWLGLIGPPSSAKTEILASTALLPKVVQAATLTPAGLLSGTPKKQHVKGAMGGMLRQIGEFGIIALKDFGSILSMRPDAKAETLAALREIYDGSWTRILGTDGGQMLSWRGKVGLIFCSTGVIDMHYSVIGAMGDRFLLSRLAPVEDGQFARALKHVGGRTKQMRKELAEAVAGLFAARRLEPRPITEEEIGRIDGIITLVVRLRGAVERDRSTREIEAVYGAEGTARIGLMLERLLAGLDTLGVEREKAMEIVEGIAMSSVPPIRRRAYEFLDAKDGQATTAEVAEALGLPTVTVRRALEDLAAYDLVTRSPGGKGGTDKWHAGQTFSAISQ